MSSMYSYLKGIISEKNLDNSSLTIEINGIGYLIYTNLKFINSFHLNDTAKIYTSLISKEDGSKLYGFSDRAHRDLFEILISVSGVGPKAALSLLNILDLNSIVSAVMQDKPKIISEAPGIGPKTAKRLVLELNNKLHKFNKNLSELETHSSYGCQEEVSNVLGNLGFSAIEIDKILTQAKAESIQDEPELLVKFCLKNLAAVN